MATMGSVDVKMAEELAYAGFSQMVRLNRVDVLIYFNLTDPLSTSDVDFQDNILAFTVVRSASQR